MLWAITSYFNPCQYARRKINYRVFRDRLNVPLIAVELGFDGRFDLQSSDADILVRVSDGDVMFQKERLLNIALQHLPDECTAVAWLDSDVVFSRDDWGAMAEEKLNSADVLQLYSTGYRIEPHVPVNFNMIRREGEGFPSLFERFRSGNIRLEEWRENPSVAMKSRIGLAWCTRREFLERHGFYDACIVGGGDRAFIGAIVGRPAIAVRHLEMQSGFQEHYLEWVERLLESGEPRLDHIDVDIVQLWHGDYAHRKYKDRHAAIAQFQFHPGQDLMLGEDGCWKWNESGSRLAGFVNEYFQSRMEDGLPDSVAA